MSKVRVSVYAVLGACVLGMVYCASPRRLPDGTRHPVAVAKASMRSIATSLEAYYIDNSSYPPMVPLAEATQDPEWLREHGGSELSTVSPVLSTPVAYITETDREYPDPFSGRPLFRLRHRGSFFTRSYEAAGPFAYYTAGSKWLLFSPGPDLDYDIDPASDYGSEVGQFPERLVGKTFDVTNGMKSEGDICRPGP